MKNIFFIAFSIIVITTFSQVDTTSKYFDYQEDSVVVKERYMGLNVGTFVVLIANPNASVLNYSLFYKVSKSNRTIYKFKLNYYSKEKPEVYGFTDSLNNMVTRTYKNMNGVIDIRAGIGLHDKLGFGEIYVTTSAIVGYAKFSKSYDDAIVYVTDSVVSGIGGEAYDVSEADYFTLGIDFAFGYEIDLGTHLTFGFEYNPEFSYYSMISEEYYFENTTSYNKGFINSNFSVFNLNLLYKF